MALRVFCRRMMNFNRFNCANFIISKRKFSDTGDVLLVQKLRERTLLRLNGQRANEYLQGLMTNDMNHFNSGASSIYAMFLNNKGRLLYDSIIYKTSSDNTYLIECDINAALPLLDHLNHYKVRRKINVDISDEYDIWAVSKNNHIQNLDDVPDYKNLVSAIKEKLPKTFSTIDPRLQSMGLRIISQKDANLSDNLEKILNVKTRVDNFYKLLRYRLGIGEGMNELLYGKSFPLEINGDYMHGISFHKGCYIGQELTARTYHIGEIRKRIMPIKFDDKVSKFEHGTSICTSDSSNKAIGKLYGAEEANGIALLRIEEALKGNQMIMLNKKCETHRPFWWPIEARKTRMKSG